MRPYSQFDGYNAVLHFPWGQEIGNPPTPPNPRSGRDELFFPSGRVPSLPSVPFEVGKICDKSCVGFSRLSRSHSMGLLRAYSAVLGGLGLLESAALPSRPYCHAPVVLPRQGAHTPSGICEASWTFRKDLA